MTVSITRWDATVSSASRFTSSIRRETSETLTSVNGVPVTQLDLRTRESVTVTLIFPPASLLVSAGVNYTWKGNIVKFAKKASTV